MSGISAQDPPAFLTRRDLSTQDRQDRPWRLKKVTCHEPYACMADRTTTPRPTGKSSRPLIEHVVLRVAVCTQRRVHCLERSTVLLLFEVCDRGVLRGYRSSSTSWRRHCDALSCAAGCVQSKDTARKCLSSHKVNWLDVIGARASGAYRCLAAGSMQPSFAKTFERERGGPVDLGRVK